MHVHTKVGEQNTNEIWRQYRWIAPTRLLLMFWVQYIHWSDIRKGNWSITYTWKLWLEWASSAWSPHTIHFFPMANEVMKRHVSRGDLNSPHQQKAPVSTYWQSIMGNKLHGTQEFARFYFSTRYIRLGVTNTSSTLYCIYLVTILSMLKRLKSAIAVFVFEQSDFIFLCVSAIHAGRTICKDYVMNCLSVLYKTSLVTTPCFSVHITLNIVLRLNKPGGFAKWPWY